ncbi:oligosaccharide flippase family protein [Noviherbaspirillum galbum]|uniref:Oligosaccharide flippase family protein n=1 Tax=Noviherbaspirillum galbum TaxID=2709383 RepID=A0A6B3SV37_9BURK|nr:oligosaccharide flippase family protein [Noviherbaspirillum galbum]NEX64484.1 oligosaccharide flippase family protein [Noviherbaspirillum galbum]
MHTARFFLFNLLGHGLPLLVALVSVPVVAHHAGVERLGALGVVWALVGFASFLDFGLGRVVTRRVASTPDRAGRDAELALLRGFFRRQAIPALAVLGLLLLAGGHAVSGLFPMDALGRELQDGWPWIAAGVPVTLATNWLRGILEGLHRFARVNVLRAAFGGLNYAAPALASLAWPRLDAMIAGIVAGRVAGLLAHAWVCWRAEPGILAGPPASGAIGVRSFFQEGGWITVSNVVGPLMVYSDRFVLGMMLPPRAVAWYVTGQEIMLRTLVIPGALSGVLFPQFAGDAERKRPGGQPLRAVYQRGLRVAAALMLPLCVLAAIGSYDGLRWWLGDEFALHAYQVVDIVAIGIYANALSHLPLAWLQATGHASRAAKAQLLELPAYALGLAFAVRHWGIEGVAAVWAWRVGVDCLVLLLLAGADAVRTSFLPLLAGLALVALAGLASGPQHQPAWRLGAALLMTGLALGWAWAGLLNGADRQKFQRLVSTVRLRPRP